MSYPFFADGKCLWDPALQIGKMFLNLALGAADTFRVQSGLTPRTDGACDMDMRVFNGFVDELRSGYRTTRHPVQHEMMRGILLVSLVLLESGGVTVTPVDDAEAELLKEAFRLAKSMVDVIGREQ